MRSYSLCIFAVIKADYIFNDDASEGYRFPDHDDNLTEFNGGAVQLSVPSSLLQTISEYNIIIMRKFDRKCLWNSPKIEM